MVLALEFLVQPAGGLRLGVHDLLGPGVEPGEALVQPPHLAALDPEAGPGHVLQESAIVADDQQGRATRLQPLLQSLDGEDVEVVGGLVEQQHLGVLGKGPRQGDAPDFPARQPSGGALWVQAEGFEFRLGPVDFGPAAAGVVDQPVGDDQRLLRHPDDPRRWMHRALAGVGVGLARQDAHQGGFAGSIPPDQAGPRAGLQRQVDPVEQRRRPVLQTDVLEGEDRWAAHLAASAKSWPRSW